MTNPPTSVTGVRAGIARHRPIEPLEPRTLLYGVEFAAQTIDNVGAAPMAVAVADLDADGAADVVIGHFEGHEVSVLRGRGDGTFYPQRRVSTGTRPRSVVIADMNTDGIPDIVTANHGGDPDGSNGSISVLLGRGDGSFHPQLETSVAPGYCIDVAVSDLNNDGKADVAIAADIRHVTILLGRGDGTFAAQGDFPTDPDPASIAVGDFNGDDKADLVIHNWTLNILLGNGDGSFQAQYAVAEGGWPGSVEVADVNADGHADIITAEGGDVSAFSEVLLGVGDGTFQRTPGYHTGGYANAVAITDFDGDGILDIVSAHTLGGVGVHLGKGDGTFVEPQRFVTDMSAWGVAAADLNGDDKMDIVSANRFANSSSVLLNIPVPLPAVVSAQFEFYARQPRLSFRFNKDLGYTFEASDLILKNLTTGAIVASSKMWLNYDAPTDTWNVEFYYAYGILPDGDYRATLPAGSVSDSLGNGMAEDATVEFFAFAGDANRDRKVDIADLAIVSTHWGKAGNFSHGDFNYNGQVDFYDRDIVAARWQTSLAPPAPTKTPATFKSRLEDESTAMQSIWPES